MLEPTPYADVVKRLFHWQFSRTNCFHDLLFDLIRKADSLNIIRLRLAFPNEVRAVEEWDRAGDYGNDLFRDHGLNV